jgi:Spy/CpxP family protein refolding chaperone
MRTVRVLLILAAALLIARPLFAQDQPKEPKARGDRAARGGDFGLGFLRDLNLTDEQKTKVKDLTAKYGRDSVLTDEQKKARTDALEAAKKDGKTGRDLFKAAADAVKLTDDQKAKAKENRKSFMDELNKILTDEQKEKLKSAMKDRRGRRAAAAPKAEASK